MPKRKAVQLRELREKRGMTQRQVADHVGVQPQAISNLERGEDRPSLKTALALANLFGVDVADFLVENRPATATQAQAKP